MVLRLDPAIPLVWRDPSTLQFGVDPVVTVLEGVTHGIERLVAILTAGVSESGLRMLAGTLRVSRPRLDRLLRELAPCLLTAAPPTPPRRTVLVLGGTPLAAALARLLDELGARTTDAAHPDLAVLVADRVVPPADHRVWLRRDVPHLPVVTGDASVTIGPLVAPGVSACLHCVALHRRDADPAWPAVAAQLLALRAPAPHPLRAASAVALAARLVSETMRGEATPGRELRVEGDGESVTERVVAPHPECRCAAPPGSDWAPADATASPPPPSAGTASGGRG